MDPLIEHSGTVSVTSAFNAEWLNASFLAKMDLNGLDIFTEEYSQYKGIFIYVSLFFIPLALAANYIQMVSSFLMTVEGKDPKCVYMCLCNFAIADLIACLALFVGVIEINNMNDKYMCLFQIGSIISGSLTSMLSICLIAVERFMYIVHGLKYDAYFTPTRTGVVIILVWLCGLSFGLVPILVAAGNIPGEYVELCEFILCPNSVIIAAASLAVPALIITPIAYIMVYHHARRAAQKLSTEGRISPFKLKSILVVYLSSITFLVCWGPYILCVFVYKFYCEPNRLDCLNLEMALVSPLLCLGFANSLLNPIIYAWWHPPYNAALRKVLCPARVTKRDSISRHSPTVSHVA